MSSKSMWVMRVTPWAVSLCIHIAIAVALLFVVLIAGDKPSSEVIYPDSQFTDSPAGRFDGDGGGGTNLQNSPELAAATPVIQPVRASVPGNAATAAPDLGGGAASTNVELFGIGGGGGPAGGQPNSLGLAGTGGTPRGSFFGIHPGGNAHHIVYVVDRSGSMTTGGSFERMQAELLRSIGGLSEKQDFHVIFFADEKPLENPPYQLVTATVANKREAARFLKTVVAANKSDIKTLTNPVPAFVRAFQVFKEADSSKSGMVIFFLTDGESSRDVLMALEDLNREKKVHINAILINAEGDAGVMKRIAAENGGIFRAVSTDD